MVQTSLLSKSRRLLSTKKKVSIDTYFNAEEKALEKHEFHNGTIIKMAGAKLPHFGRLPHCS